MLQRREVVSCHCRTTRPRLQDLSRRRQRQRQRQRCGNNDKNTTIIIIVKNIYLLGSIIILALSLLFSDDNVVVINVGRVESFTPTYISKIPYPLHYNNANDVRQQQQQQQQQQNHHSRINQLLRLFSTSSSSSSLEESSNIEVEKEEEEEEEEMLLTKKSNSNSNSNSNCNVNDNDNDNDKAPLLITIGPPCSNKKLAIESYLLSEQQLGIGIGIGDNVNVNGNDNDNGNGNNEALNDTDLNYEIINLRSNSIGVYHRIPLAAYIYPSSHLTDEIGKKILYDDITVKDRILNMPDKYESTDTEIRNVCLRLAGRITSDEFAMRTRELALQAGDTIEYFKQRRILVMEDLILAVEEVAVEAIGEVIMQNELKIQQQMAQKMQKQMELQKQKQQQMEILRLSELQDEDDEEDVNNNQTSLATAVVSIVGSDGVEDLPYEEEDDDDDDDDDEETAKEQQEGTPVIVPALINATSAAHLLSAKALIKTPYVELYVPQNIFNDGVRRSENQLHTLLSDDDDSNNSNSNSKTNMIWMNTNTRPSEYVIALNAAQQCKRPVKFIFWGGCSSGSTNDNNNNMHFHFPSLSRKELLKNNIKKFRNTGRYIPAGAIGGSLDRIENFIKTAEEIATKAASAVNTARDNRNNNNSQNNENHENNNNQTDYDNNDSKNGEKDDEGNKEGEEEVEQQRQSKKETTMTPMMMMDTAFAYLGGFHINMDTGLVKKVGECKQLKQPFPFRNTNTNANSNSNTNNSKYPKKWKKKTMKSKIT